MHGSEAKPRFQFISELVLTLNGVFAEKSETREVEFSRKLNSKSRGEISTMGGTQPQREAGKPFALASKWLAKFGHESVLKHVKEEHTGVCPARPTIFIFFIC